MSYRLKVILYALGSLTAIAITLILWMISGEKPEDAIRGYSGLAFAMLITFLSIVEFLFLFGVAILMRLRGRKLARKYREAGKTDLAIATTTKHDRKAKTFFLASGLVLLVGCSLCFGGAYAVTNF